MRRQTPAKVTFLVADHRCTKL